MLYEQELKTFVEGTTNFFEVAAQQAATIESPYLMGGSAAVHEYTGITSISGKREGVVYFTASKAMLTVLLMKMKENAFSHETMKDLVGEVANTISGNARRDFGRDFVISVPSVLSGEKPELPHKPGQRAFIIPINWRSHSGKLVAPRSYPRSTRAPRAGGPSASRRRVLVGTQPIAQPGLGHQIARLPRVRLELGAQILYAHPEAARVILALRAPHLADQLALHDDAAQVARQAGEHAVLERREVHLAGRPERRAACQIHLQRGELQRGGGRGPAPVAAHPRAQPRQQLRRTERLGDVVVGAGIQRGDLLLLHGARRQHHDRHLRPAAHAADHVQAVLVGQPQVDQQQVRLVAARLDLRALGGVGL